MHHVLLCKAFNHPHTAGALGMQEGLGLLGVFGVAQAEKAALGVGGDAGIVGSVDRGDHGEHLQFPVDDLTDGRAGGILQKNA